MDKWIPLNERMPTEADADDDGIVYSVNLSDKHPQTVKRLWLTLAHCNATHWAPRLQSPPIPKRPLFNAEDDKQVALLICGGPPPPSDGEFGRVMRGIRIGRTHLAGNLLHYFRDNGFLVTTQQGDEPTINKVHQILKAAME